MKASDILVEEHRVIKRMLACLERIAEEASLAGKLNDVAAEQALTFFREFADKCHHAKEEDRLFPVMESHGFTRHGGPTGVMLDEHVQGRKFIAAMSDAVTLAGEGDAEAVRAFRLNARNYVDLLLQHIDKEDHCLFRMADQVLDDTAKQALLEEFRQIETDAGGKRHETYIGMAQRLCEEYGVPFLEDQDVRLVRQVFMRIMECA